MSERGEAMERATDRIEDLVTAIRDALTTLEVPTPQAVAAAVEILRGALNDGFLRSEES